ncbi:phage protease [Methylosinus sp. Sm6]|uniref:phage protease n=1 Tax=Methylosinus sp. Sm6 TaxID=2866948 RepID=UPI001C99B270|nr:phage protease [Methylosinus sp. Sm6]MBY6244118.1 phage protease [Methylosinus sp. Sm6]
MIRTDASPLRLALCHAVSATAIGEAIALNLEGEALPDWVMVAPAGPVLRGADGRMFKIADPDALVAATMARGLKLPIDINHAQFLRAPRGEESPAAGWIEELQARDGAVWGRVDWTESGRAALAARSYRYLSPALLHDDKGAVAAIAGAGLVNRPNFSMPALNAHQENDMDKELLKKLGLPETASLADVLAALEKMQTSLNAAQTPALSLYVPRADYDAVLARATGAEAALNAAAEGNRKAKAAALVEQAVKDGKIAPATRDFYIGLCATEAGLAEVTKFVGLQPSVFTPSNIGKTEPATQVALNADRRAAALAMGLDEKAFAEFLAAQPAA